MMMTEENGRVNGLSCNMCVRLSRGGDGMVRALVKTIKIIIEFG